MKSIDKYIQDCKDTFGDSYKKEKFFHLIEDLKQAQKKAFPTEDFRLRLKSRLDNVFLEMLSEDVQPRFNLYRIFGLLGSFIFISSAVLMISVVRETEISTKIPMNQESDTIMEVEIMKIQDNSILDESHIPEAKLFKNNIGETSISEIQNMPSISDENREDAIISDDNVYEEESSISARSMLMSEGEYSADDASIGSADFMGQEALMADSQLGNEVHMQEFYKICEGNNGVVVGNTVCEFKSGDTCEMETMFPDSAEKCPFIYESENESVK